MDELLKQIEDAPVFNKNKQLSDEAKLLVKLFAKRFNNESEKQATEYLQNLLFENRIKTLKGFILICQKSRSISEIEENIQAKERGFTKTDLINVMSGWYNIPKDAAQTILYLLKNKYQLDLACIPKVMKHCKTIKELLNIKLKTLQEIGLDAIRENRNKYETYLNLNTDENTILRIIGLEAMKNSYDEIYPITNDLCFIKQKYQEN